MKASVAAIAIIALLIGLGIGWVAKPAAPATTSTVTTTVTKTVGAPGAKTITVTSTTTVQAAAKGVLPELKKKGKIVIATSPDWPPFEFIDPKTNQIVGYEIDLMNEIAKKLGLKVEWKAMDFDAIIEAVKTGQVDMGVSGFSVTSKRLNEVIFSMPHIVTNAELIMLEKRAKELGITKVDKIEDAAKAGLVIGTGSGTTEEEELDALVKAGIMKKDQLKVYPDFDTALEALKKGDVDAVYAEYPITQYWMEESKEPMIIVFSRPYTPIAFVLPKNAQDLKLAIDKALADMFINGDVYKIRLKWGIRGG